MPRPRGIATRAMSAVAEQPRAPAGLTGLRPGARPPDVRFSCARRNVRRGAWSAEGSLDGRSADGESTPPHPQQRIDFGLVGALETAAPLVRPNPRPRAAHPARARHRSRGCATRTATRKARQARGMGRARRRRCARLPLSDGFSPSHAPNGSLARGRKEIVDRPAATARDPDRAIARSPARRARSRLPPRTASPRLPAG